MESGDLPRVRSYGRQSEGALSCRRIVPDDKRTDEEIRADIRAWRDAHPRTVKYWRELAWAIQIAIRTGQPFAARAIVASFEDGNLYLTLPSGRRITYP